MPRWLNDAVFYEIYPQSFYDTNADGIGDIPGIIEKLDYIQSLGCNAIWLNPCFDSPFKDAGYDVRDYKKVAPRYGTNADMARCFAEVHKRGMHILLDLVPGHTSEEHPWFTESSKAARNEYSDRYIWTNHWYERTDPLPGIGGESEREAMYALNFFKCQPALNYGFWQPTAPWQLPVDHPACLATREAMKDVMRFWLDMGCDGFRVDMAGSLVKGDDARFSGTSAIWRDVRAMLDREYPEAALVAEWGQPEFSLSAGFHMDFYLSWSGNGYTSLMRDYGGPDGEDNSYFKSTSHTSIVPFLSDYMPKYRAAQKSGGLFCLLTCNHDTTRPRFSLSPEELKLAYAFLFTMPGAPYLYYGDEIGMRYLDVPTKEGGYTRTGSRTPMQWQPGRSLGFSAAEDPARLYLPTDPAPDAPTVAAQEDDPHSLLNTVRALLTLRHKYDDLQAGAPFEMYQAKADSRLFVYRRGALLLAVNPSLAPCTFDAPEAGHILYTIGACTGTPQKGRIELGPQSFVVLGQRE